MGVTLPDPGDAFDPPDGSPGALRGAAGTFGQLASDLTTDSKTAKTAVVTATSHWHGKRRQEFEDGILGPQLQISEMMATAKEVDHLLGQIATALGRAQDDVAEAKRKYDALRTSGPRHHGPDNWVDDAVVIVKAETYIGDARDAKRTLKSTCRRIAGEIGTQTNRLVPGGSTLDPAAIAKKVAHRTGVTGVGSGPVSTAQAWKIIAAGKAHADAIESLAKGDNADGSRGGGPYSSLPSDPAALEQMLASMRADEASMSEQHAVLQQYWVAHAAKDAGINLDEWDPSFDAKGNAATIPKVYKFYGEVYKKDPRLKWAGLANIVGPIFAAGFDDLGDIHKLTDKLKSLPSALRDQLPPDIRNVIETGGRLSSKQVKFFEDKFLAMQKHIFMDGTAARIGDI